MSDKVQNIYPYNKGRFKECELGWGRVALGGKSKET